VGGSCRAGGALAAPGQLPRLLLRELPAHAPPIRRHRRRAPHEPRGRGREPAARRAARRGRPRRRGRGPRAGPRLARYRDRAPRADAPDPRPAYRRGVRLRHHRPRLGDQSPHHPSPLSTRPLAPRRGPPRGPTHPRTGVEPRARPGIRFGSPRPRAPRHGRTEADRPGATEGRHRRRDRAGAVRRADRSARGRGRHRRPKRNAERPPRRRDGGRNVGASGRARLTGARRPPTPREH